MANCKSNNARNETNNTTAVENHKHWTPLSSNLARFANKVNPSRSADLKQEGPVLPPRGCQDFLSTHFESPGVMKDEGLNCLRVRNVYSKGDLTAMTAGSSSEESSTASEADNYVHARDNIRAMGRPAFRRSLTDEDYNLFLEFLETPSHGTPYQPSHCSVPLPSTEVKSVARDTHRSMPNSGSLSRQDVNCPRPGRTSCTSDDLSFDLLLARLQGTPEENDPNGDDVSILLTDGLDELDMEPAPEDFIQARGTPLSRGKENITSSAIAWSALAALLGTHSPSSPYQEKKTRVVKNLWVDETADEDDIISLADSEDFFVDDAASVPSLVVESHEVF